MVEIPYEGPKFASSCSACNYKAEVIRVLQAELEQMTAWKNAAATLAIEILEEENNE